VRRLHDVLARKAAVVLAGAGGPVDLREDLQPLAALPLERASEDLLGARARVDVRGVEGGDPGVEGRAHARVRRVLLDLGAVGEPVAVGDLADLQTTPAELSELHGHDPNPTMIVSCAGPSAPGRRPGAAGSGRRAVVPRGGGPASPPPRWGSRPCPSRRSAPAGSGS